MNDNQKDYRYHQNNDFIFENNGKAIYIDNLLYNDYIYTNLVVNWKMPDNTYADLFDNIDRSNVWSTWSLINTSAPTQIIQSIQYQFDPNLDEKDFFELSYGKEYWWLRISNGRYIIRQKNTLWTNDLILHDWTKEISRIENVTVSANWNKEVINGKTWLCVSKDCDINSTDDNLLINWICVDDLDKYNNNEYRFMNVTWIVKVCEKGPSNNNPEVAYYLVDHGFPKSFREHILDAWETFDDLVNNWLPELNSKNLIKLFVNNSKYKEKHHLVIINTSNTEYIPGKLVKAHKVWLFHDRLLIIESEWIKKLYSARLGKLYENIETIETQIIPWTSSSVQVTIHLPGGRYDKVTLWNSYTWEYSILPQKRK